MESGPPPSSLFPPPTRSSPGSFLEFFPFVLNCRQGACVSVFVSLCVFVLVTRVHSFESVALVGIPLEFIHPQQTSQTREESGLHTLGGTTTTTSRLTTAGPPTDSGCFFVFIVYCLDKLPLLPIMAKEISPAPSMTELNACVSTSGPASHRPGKETTFREWVVQNQIGMGI